MSFSRSLSAARRAHLLLVLLAACVCPGFLTTSVFATPIPKNLGNGLDKLVESNVAMKQAREAKETKGAKGERAQQAETFTSVRTGAVYATEQAAAFADAAISDDQDRVLVRINPDGSLSAKETADALSAAIGSLTVTAIDENYRGVGVMNAFVSVDDAAALAMTPGVRSVILELRPRHNGVVARPLPGPVTDAGPVTNAISGQVLTKLGLAFDQGVTQHRVDQINKFYNPTATLDYEGAGMSVGFMSDSYDTRTFNTPPTPRAPTDVNSFDLPGSASNPVPNTQPVVVLQDIAGGTDEGRGMGQIVYKMAPKARIAFASADFGEVGFANNIRALAGIPAYVYPPATQQGFKADTICDDVGYFDEPFYQDGIIGGGIDDAAAAGVSYFSSAANDIGINGYESVLRWVPNGSGLTAAAGNTALAGTNINLNGVPAALYAGGFHNFNPNPGQQDVAQTVNLPAANNDETVLQWDEPYDQNTTPNLINPPLYTNGGTITSSVTTVTFNDIPNLTAGTLYQIDADAVPGSGVDVTVTLLDPSNNVVVSQDNTVDEVVHFFAPVTGHYTLTIGRFSTTTGAFTVTIHAATGYTGQTIATDINLLCFRVDTGAYVAASSLTANNFATNQPIELGFTNRPSGQTQLQYVFSRANVPVGDQATHIRYLIPGNGAGGIGPAEYFTYDTVTTGGHATAAGCNGTAAYSVFRPNIPESFTSPGPATIYFDKLGNRLAVPDVRLQPRVAAADAANGSSFSGDTGTDPDTSPNFSGTSAAGPHAAAIAALVLEAHGGPGSVTPAHMTSILQQTAFPHDLDPSFSSGSARATNGGKVTVSITSDGSANNGTGQNDNNAMAVSYVGPSSLATLVFNPTGTAATAGCPSCGNNGVNYTGNGSTFPTVTYFENNFPGMVFAPATKAFTIGSGSTITAANVVATFANLAPAPSTTQSWTMNLAFPTANFTGGNVLRFNVGRAIQHSAATGTTIPVVNGSPTTSANPSADLVGGGVSIPSGTVVNDGMTFSGTTTDGGTFSGVIRNRLGAGYSKTDGYGFMNAAAAVVAP